MNEFSGHSETKTIETFLSGKERKSVSGEKNEGVY